MNLKKHAHAKFRGDITEFRGLHPIEYGPDQKDRIRSIGPCLIYLVFIEDKIFSEDRPG
jgi:hypothetical protein